MNGRRQRIAWIFLFGSLFSCLALVVAVPLGANTLLQRATRALDVTVQANQGTVGLLQDDRQAGAIFAGNPAQELTEGAAVLTNATDTALVLATEPNDGTLVARIQVYGNSSMGVERATTPRFSASDEGNHLNLNVSNGRVVITLPADSTSTTLVTVSVPQGQVHLYEPGQFSITASNAGSQVSVFEGTAELVSGDQLLALGADQRGVLDADGRVAGPLGTERNLIANGNFLADLDNWVVLASVVEIAGQSAVETRVAAEGGEPALTFSRVGVGHADVGVRQILNEDLTDYSSLRLQISMRISEQSLGVCGEQGSECPLTVRLEFEDVNGVSQTWQQGYYAQGQVGPSTPDVCVTCPPPLTEHQAVPFGQLVFVESENLLERLGQLGMLPRRIKTITLTAAGHSFVTEVVDVALLAREAGAS